MHLEYGLIKRPSYLIENRVREKKKKRLCVYRSNYDSVSNSTKKGDSNSARIR
jgi:hypothetical protein